MSILFHCTFPNEDKWFNSVKRKFKNHKVYKISNKFDYNLIQYAIVWNLPDKVLNKLKNLKIIFSLGAGVDHIINLPSYNNTPIFRIKDPNMAERMSYHVHSQILVYQLKLHLFQKAQIKRKWLGEQETLLNNKITVGILGAGFLGTAVGRYLKKLNYRVIGFKKYPIKIKKYFTIYTKKKLGIFIKNSDIIVSILPYTEETKNFINEKFLKKMKKKSLLINIGRGASLNENHLLMHLEKNKNFYASLDVFKTEPLPRKHKFWTHKNVIVTPHAAALTDIDSSIKLMHDRYLSYKKNGKIKSDVNLKRGY
tara:strand:- start:8148 stop:9077 length:930 start_codon:yes stop_codon:yes gene_type:complete